ncbi:hypothetical protein BATDEDRAFT_92051 [Batrachochytrium dendrobatidis JAM81]|uniref:Uncharacterized protein n=1 Tax=Batrachochytrium dendrobatidis (strain JAM81 / FGSC 10211) TaxID=684364 RepID=F4PCG0_BATDJ|nr:uncharacterized protein BATDEDRAFT_92051 [Batrachochytrium dendrobatidis JAM81]EGF77082.1 hypothetical protein BATDEDRAFT_92051 [Batrachochytrium dendrobatidis JAM81]KAJ8330413.1 hypothetical protein O5D80_001407 [Batrachochytrium dendrobatidis]KAK5665400.1 hypothetical protein QVD99_007752 [Batrachochytrium dendrobatidis]|eukprot:XP_006682267.1 hypothetical protein BATDEDRAFT_92051 [Batrachochytrium dendrobatidis JAM81]
MQFFPISTFSNANVSFVGPKSTGITPVKPQKFNSAFKSFESCKASNEGLPNFDFVPAFKPPSSQPQFTEPKSQRKRANY